MPSIMATTLAPLAPTLRSDQYQLSCTSNKFLDGWDAVAENNTTSYRMNPPKVQECQNDKYLKGNIGNL